MSTFAISMQIAEHLMRISSCHLSVHDSYTVNLLLYSTNELNGISAHLKHVAEISKLVSKLKHPFSLPAQRELWELWCRIDTFLSELGDSPQNAKPLTALWMERQNLLIEENIKELKKNHIKRLRYGACSVETGMYFLELLTDYEQIVSYCICLFDKTFITNHIEERNY